MDNERNDTIQIDFAEEMRTSFRDYAVSVIIARALPDVRDGLKPVQRRILYAMNELGLDPKKPHRKSARIVGDTMGKYHPHGDTSIYDALVHMTEDYSLAIPLVDGHGNFGSIDGDGAAAMRYTEARLSEGAMTMLEHLDKGLVEFIPNFDESEKEPTVLPAMLPNLLINGTTGIAVGMATNIPPHNPAEVIDAAIAVMHDPAVSTEELMQLLPGPDFPTSGTVINGDELLSLYETGEGKIRIRAKAQVEGGDNGKRNIVITEIPYTVAGTKSKLMESLSDALRNKTFDEIADVRDESSKEGIRIVNEDKKDRDVENLLNGLYKKTPLEDTFSAYFLAVKDNQPRQFGLRAMLQEFVDFQEELYTKEYRYLLDKAEKRLEIVSGLMRAVDVIDYIIEVIRGSSTVKQVKECLTKGVIEDIRFKTDEAKRAASSFDFTEAQADAILAMQMQKLVGLEILKLSEEQDDLTKKIKLYNKILGKKSELYKVIEQQLLVFRERFARERRTVITNSVSKEYVIEEKIEDLMILMDRFGYTKAVDVTAYQKAGDDVRGEFTQTVRIQSNDRLCIFTAEGNMYQLKVSAIPRCRIKEKGTLLQVLTKIDQETPILLVPAEELDNSMLLFLTKHGWIKCVSGSEFFTNRAVIASTKLEDDDSLVGLAALSSAEFNSGKQKVVILTEKKLSLGFPLEQVNVLGKTAKGVRAISLDKKDAVLYGTSLDINTEEFVFDGKTYNAKRIRNRARGAKGQNATL